MGRSVVEQKEARVEVLQKLLMPGQSRDVLERGASDVGGAVVRATDAAGLRTPRSIVEAYAVEDRFPADAPVDVVRFPMVRLMQVDRPVPAEAPWPTYATGFLRCDDVVPVWMLHRTRLPRGSELWRLHPDGSTQVLAVFGGAGRGWRGAAAYLPPSPFVGPRARWRGGELTADVDDSGTSVELVLQGERLEGFTATGPGVSTRSVPIDECEAVFERVLTCSWQGVPCRVLGRGEHHARLLLTAPTPEDVARLGITETEPGIFEVVAPLEELTDHGGFSRELPRATSSA